MFDRALLQIENEKQWSQISAFEKLQMKTKRILERLTINEMVCCVAFGMQWINIMRKRYKKEKKDKKWCEKSCMISIGFTQFAIYIYDPVYLAG